MQSATTSLERVKSKKMLNGPATGGETRRVVARLCTKVLSQSGVKKRPSMYSIPLPVEEQDFLSHGSVDREQGVDS